jgi:radical SAM protein with 4Fe4S-binding SPASM domain
VDEIDPQAVADSVRRIKSRRWSFPYIFMPELAPEDIPAYYRDHANTLGYKQCRYPWLVSDIMPNGDVVTCRDYPDVVTGNIKNDSILNIWNSRRSRAFRQLLKDQGGLLPICSRCCGIMGV